MTKQRGRILLHNDFESEEIFHEKANKFTLSITESDPSYRMK